MLDKQSRNLGADGTITRKMVGIIKSTAHVFSNTFLSIFLRRDTLSFLEDIWKVTLIDKTDLLNPLRRGNCQRSTLKTMVPWGLNVENFV